MLITLIPVDFRKFLNLDINLSVAPSTVKYSCKTKSFNWHHLQDVTFVLSNGQERYLWKNGSELFKNQLKSVTIHDPGFATCLHKHCRCAARFLQY